MASNIIDSRSRTDAKAALCSVYCKNKENCKDDCILHMLDKNENVKFSELLEVVKHEDN